MYLKKPIYSFPIHGQFEQYINAAYIEKLGYGKHATSLNTADLSAFIAAIPAYKSKLAHYQQNGNQKLFDILQHSLLS